MKKEISMENPQINKIKLTLFEIELVNVIEDKGGKVFIDWNIDGDFNDLGEEVGSIPYGVNSLRVLTQIILIC